MATNIGTGGRPAGQISFEENLVVWRKVLEDPKFNELLQKNFETRTLLAALEAKGVIDDSDGEIIGEKVGI